MQENMQKTMSVNGIEYQIHKLLGRGKGGYSYLAEKDGVLYVLKQIHHEPCDYYTFGNKIEAEKNDYAKLLETGIRIPKMMDIDIENERIIKEYIDGPTISELVEKDAMKETYIDQVKEMAGKVYSFGLNIDYYPTNFVVQEDLIYYIDYECNSYMEEWNLENWGIKYWITFPEQIRNLIMDKPYTIDDIGLSGNQVLIFEDMVLKIEKAPGRTGEQVMLMRWLEGKVSVPKVLAYVEENNKNYLLMTRMKGKMSCDTEYLDNPSVLLAGLAEGLKTLWSVDVTDCPVSRDLDRILKEAEFEVENNLVDVDNVEPTTFGEGGFESPAHLLKWLKENRPSYEPVLSHGDYCLPNVFLENGKLQGFIDLDRAGVGDKWNDIALCYRSLKHNFDGTYGGKVYEDFDPDMLFEALGMEPDWDKIKYYTLLDELF